MSNEFGGCAKVLSFRVGAPLCTGFVHRSRGGTSSIALYPTHCYVGLWRAYDN